MSAHTGLVRILIADDHDLVRAGLISVMQASHPEWQVVGEASNGRQAIEMAETLRPDVVMLDISMPELNGLEVTRYLSEKLPGIRILILTVHMAHQLMRLLRRAGARAFLSKSEAPQNLVAVLENILAGVPFLASPSASRPASELDPEEQVPVQYLLTPRELEVLRLLARGRSNKEIAGDLNLSVRTAESHRADIMDRLSVDSLADLIRLAVRDNVI